MTTPSAATNLDNPTLMADFLMTLIESTTYAMKVQGSLEILETSSKIYDSESFKEPIAIAATIGIVGDTVKGGITLAFPKETFLAIASEMLGEKYTEINSEIQDLSGEFLNIIFGGIKSKFTDGKKIPLQPAVPIVVRSEDLRFSFDTKEATYIVTFKTKLGIFFAAAAITLK